LKRILIPIPANTKASIKTVMKKIVEKGIAINL